MKKIASWEIPRVNTLEDKKITNERVDRAFEPQTSYEN